MKTTLTKEQIRQRDEVFARFDKKLPKEYAALAKLRWDPEFKKEFKDGNDSVSCAFFWQGTPEGFDFWLDVDCAMCRGDRELPPIPAESLAELRKTTMSQPYTLTEQQIKNSTKAQLAEALATAFGDVHRLSARVNELTEENASLREKNEEQKSEIDMLLGEIERGDDEEANAIDLQNQLDNAERDIRQFEGDLKATRDDLRAVRDENVMLKARLESASALLRTYLP